MQTRGKVNILGVVNEEGKLYKSSVFNSSQPDFNEEALRIAKLIKWKPGVGFGSVMPSEVLLKIKFKKNKALKYQQKLKENNCDKNGDYIIYTEHDVSIVPQPIFEGQNYFTVENYVIQNFEYPSTATKYSIEGKIRVSYIVEQKGYVSNIEVKQALGGGCEFEVIRLINKLQFIPGKIEGTCVRTKIETEVIIKLPKAEY